MPGNPVCDVKLSKSADPEFRGKCLEFQPMGAGSGHVCKAVSFARTAFGFVSLTFALVLCIFHKCRIRKCQAGKEL